MALLAACGGGGDGGTNPPPPTPGFTVSLSATTLSVVQGASGSITATIGRTGSFTGTVDLSIENLPAGITAAFAPAQITSGTTSTTLTANVAATVNPGSYQFTVRGRATGLTDQTAMVSITVTAAPRITMALTPTAASVAQGGTTSFAAAITRTNFTGAVAVAVTGAPANVTATVTTTGDASTINVSVGATAAPGAYPLTVTASGTGVANAVGTFTLTVTAAPQGTFTLALTSSALSIQQGQNGQTTVNITRTDFTAPITLTSAGAPTGVTVAFGQSTLNTESTTPLTLAVGGTVAAGVYPITITATSGAITQEATLQLTVTAAPAGSISLALATAIPAIEQGGSAGVTVNITRSNFAGEVTLAVTGAPNGVTTLVAPNPTATNAATVSFTVGAAVAPGSYGITITGSGTGIPNATVTGTLNVTPTPAIAIALAPAVDSVQQGGGRTFDVAITRTNFAGPVTIAVTGQPAGITTTVPASPTAGNSATVNLSVSGATALGTYPLTVTASGAGIANAVATYSLKVIQPPVSSGNVTWDFDTCVADERPIWVAAQNVSGPWQQVTGSGNSYSFTIGANGGVAYVTQGDANEYTLNIFYGSLVELQGRSSGGCALPGGKTVLGTVANVPLTNIATISLGGAAATVTAPTTAFTLENVRSGNVDLIASRAALNLATFSFATNKLIIRRGLNPAAGSTLPVLDFDAAEAFAPEERTVTINGANGEQVSVASLFFTSTSASGVLGTDIPSTSMTRTFPAVPTARQVATDLHMISASATSTSGGFNTSSRSMSTLFKDPINKTVSLGAALVTPTFSTVAGAPYLRHRAVFTAQGDYNRFWAVGYMQSGGAPRTVMVSITQSYLGGIAVDHTVPDFSSVSGWQNTWGLQPGTGVMWFASANGWTVNSGGIEMPIIEGAEIRAAQRTGSLP